MTNVASLLGADPEVASRDMRDVIEFEMELASVRGGGRITIRGSKASQSYKMKNLALSSYFDLISCRS